MSKGTRERLEELAAKAEYARELGIWVGRPREGEPYTLGFTNLSDENEGGGALKRTISFSVDAGSARYREEYPSGRSNTYDVPFDFSESFEIGDIWMGSLASDDYPKRESFQTAEAFLDFIAPCLVEGG